MGVFNAAYADQYDHLYAAKDYRAECDLIEAAILRYSTTRPSTVLDVGCGTGGHALELAQRGYHITGVDLSSPMLDHAASKAMRLPAERRPNWLCGDARSFETGQHHDLAIMMFAVVGYLISNDDVLTALRNVRRHLKPGALFLCDFWYGPTVLSMRPTDRLRVIPTGEGQVIRAATTSLDVIHHYADVTFRLWTLKGGTLTSETNESHRLRYFFPQEFTLFLSSSGFALQSMSAFPSLDQPLANDTWNAFAVAAAT